MLNKLLILVVLIGIWQWWRAQPSAAASPASAGVSVVATPAVLDEDPRGFTADLQEDSQIFACDGRQHCSQMRSRAEAEFFIAHCPNTKMDGDRDGIPCENDSRW